MGNNNQTSDNLIYHYCSAESFLAICKSQKLRFSSILHTNDYMEMELGFNELENVIKDSQMFSDISSDIEKMLPVIRQAFRDKLLPIICCLSREGDVLSQWRGYADNGKGFALGFASNVKKNIADTIICGDVKYCIDEFKEMIESEFIGLDPKHIDEIKKSIKSKSDDFIGKGFIRRLLSLSLLYKSLAFNEEKEYRMIGFLKKEQSSTGLKYTTNFYSPKRNGKTSKNNIEFYIRNSIPVPYRDLSFTQNGEPNPIKQVIIGPANQAKVEDVKIFLETMDISSVNVIQSKASYRN